MSVYSGPEISNEGLVLSLDYANSKSYSNPPFPIWKQFGGPLATDFGSNISDRNLHQSTTSTKVIPYDKSKVFGSHIDLEAFSQLATKNGAVWYKTIKSYDANGIPVTPGPGGTPIEIIFEFGPNDSMSDVIAFFLNNNGQQTLRLNDPIKVFENGVSRGQTDLVMNGWTGVGVITYNLGLANSNDTFGEPSSNYLSTGIGRHIFSYKSNSTGRDAIRCQPTCWTGSENVVNEIVWSCAAPVDLIDQSRNIVHNGYMNFDSGNGGSLVFDGTDDYVNIPFNNSLQPSTEFTLESFCYIQNNEKSWASLIQYPFSGYSHTSPYFEWGIYLHMSSRYLHTRVDGTGVSSPSGVWNFGEWVYIAITYSNQTVNYYVNGVNVGVSTGLPSSIIYQSNNRVIIGSNASGSEKYKGYISNIKVYNRALSASEIAQNFNAKRGRFGI